MTHRERTLRALRGEEVDFVPFTPRLDIWHRAGVRGGKLPDGTDPDEIARTNGWALYKVVPDFMSCGTDGIVDRGIGIYHLPCVPYDVELSPSVEREVFTGGDTYGVVYHTPHRRGERGPSGPAQGERDGRRRVPVSSPGHPGGPRGVQEGLGKGGDLGRGAPRTSFGRTSRRWGGPSGGGRGS